MIRRRSLGHLAAISAVVAAGALWAAVGAGAVGSTLYVDRGNPNCSDTGAGTSAQPFCTIGATAKKTSAGTTVLVSAGTYSEQVTVKSGAVDNPVVYRAAPGATVTVTGGQYGFYASNKSWVTIQGFTVADTTSDGFHVSSGSSHIDVIDNNVTRAGEPQPNQTAKGIAVSGASDILVQGNTVDHNSNYGLYLDTCTRVVATGNKSSFNAKGFDRAASGIRLYHSSANTVSSNVTADNEDSGIELYSSSNNNLVVDNLTYGNGDHGIDNFSATGQRMVSNTVFDNVTAGINVEGGSTGATLANNISVDNGINSPRTRSNIRVDTQSVTGTAIDYDLVNVPRPNVMIEWAGVDYSTLSAFVADTGQEAHGIQGDPGWADPANGDFHLGAGSPAIDSANSGASGESATDLEGNARVDDGSVPNTGAGPRPYDDRGALERQPPGEGPPAAALTVTPNAGLIDLDVTADASGSTDPDATPIANYRFDFGDGSPAVGPQAGATATHRYTAPGTYTVTVTVTDTAGLSSTATQQVSVDDRAPAAALSVTPSVGLAPLAVTADASASPDPDATPIASYSFDFGDGSPVSGPQSTATATHTYAVAGTYTVTVTVTDTGGQTSTATAQVDAFGDDAPPAAALNVTPASGTLALHVTADASASTDTDATPIASYRFDFGDGSAATGPQSDPTAAHTFTASGTYTVTVTVTDTAGLASTATSQVTVTDAPPQASVAVTPAVGLPPLQVTADASASRDGDATPIASYRFDFGDGTPVVGPQSGATAGHTYAAAGTYTVTVTVTDTAGLSGTSTATVVVKRNLVLNPGFETDLSGWNTSGSGANVTLTRVSGGHSGGWAASLANTGTGASTCTLNDSPNWVAATSAGTYTAALWVKGATSGATLKLRLREYSGSTLVGSALSQVTLSTAWQQVTVSYVPGAPGSSTLDLNAYIVNAASGTCFLADDASIFRG